MPPSLSSYLLSTESSAAASASFLRCRAPQAQPLFVQVLQACVLLWQGRDGRLPSNVQPLAGSFTDRECSQQAATWSVANTWRYRGIGL